MNTLSKTLGSVALAITLGLLAGCSETLDYRNAEISNNKIYSTGEDTGFTGKVTNLPLSKMPVAKIAPLTQIIRNVSMDQALSELLIANSLAGVLGKGDGSVLCDTSAKAGELDGDTVCRVVGAKSPLFTFAFERNSLVGPLVIFDAHGKGQIVAEAHYKAGNLDGPIKVFSPTTGKKLYVGTWRDGLAEGEEEVFDEDSGTVTYRAQLVNGKLDGEVTKYAPDGELLERSIWASGRRVETSSQSTVQSAPSTENPAEVACIDGWIKAYRKEQGEEALVSFEQTTEWQDWCREGKVAQSH